MKEFILIKEDQAVRLSKSAAKRIAAILADEGDKIALRISVEGGGCSGFQYKYELVEGDEQDDFILQENGARLVIDPMSLEFLKGAEIDFVNALIGQSFQIHNPNAISGCGCGVSFAV